MYYYGYNSGYSYGSGNSGCSQYQVPQYTNNGNTNLGVILVLFILLVIVIGSRIVNN